MSERASLYSPRSRKNAYNFLLVTLTLYRNIVSI